MTSSPNPALVVTRHGGREVLDVASWPVSDPEPHEVRVRVAASGINFIDVYEREGIYPTNPPFVAGGEGAGEVVAVGAEVQGIAVGDVVAWATHPGSHATYVNVDAAVVVPVPAGVEPELAAAAMLQGMTAHYLVNSTYNVQPGDSVLIHAAAGGVGQLLVQLTSARGARVIATAGTAAKRDKALALGAHVGLRYDEFETTDALAAAIRDANGGDGVSVAYDGVGQATFDASLAALAVRGMLVLFGASSGQVPPFQLQRLNFGGSLFVTRPTLRHYVRTRDELLFRASAILAAIADGSLVIDVGGRYALDDAADAYAALEGRASTGKLLLIP
jgi:NADPH2:quinone reductase